MASPTQWTWVWVGTISWWWTGRPGVLQSMGSHAKIRCNQTTELYWTCLSEKILISPSVLNEILAWCSSLGCRFFPINTLNIPCHSLLACRVSSYGSAVKCMGFPLYVTCCFSLAAFNILSLCLSFVGLISMCLDGFLLGFVLYGTLYASWTWLTISFSMLGKFSTIISSKISHILSFSLLLGPL